MNTKMRRREFIRGPIPVAWVIAAGKLLGRTLLVALAIWFRAGCRSRQTAYLTKHTCKRWGFTRQAAYRALKRLEDAGLVTLTRKPGRAIRITLRQDQIKLYREAEVKAVSPDEDDGVEVEPVS
jgi:DNA-binding MarR family transcriptional regulator